MDQATGSPHALVLDVVGMHDVDYTGARALQEMLDKLDRHHLSFAMARAGSHLRKNLARSGLLARIGPERFFATVDEAVRAFAPAEGPP
ncbi:sodium-independent anion transporter [Candidatus Aeolococcus gillhamiae]|uniref:sodium-independent anion transporter n=1 Tax=Candidatus Aeolococcus gillhamiae TaxID=3127015 RepID=UPI003077BF80